MITVDSAPVDSADNELQVRGDKQKLRSSPAPKQMYQDLCYNNGVQVTESPGLFAQRS